MTLTDQLLCVHMCVRECAHICVCVCVHVLGMGSFEASAEDWGDIWSPWLTEPSPWSFGEETSSRPKGRTGVCHSSAVRPCALPP